MSVHVKNLMKYKDLLLELIKKDIKLKYHNSYLGVLWSLVNPLLLMLILTVVFQELFKRSIPNFPVYVLTGRIIYSFFSEATNFSLDSIRVNKALIRKVYVPKYFFPISRVCSSFITNFLSIITVFSVMLVTGMKVSWLSFLIVLPLLLLLITSAGIGLILSAVNVFFRDIKHLYGVVLIFLMYTTPIFYPVEIIPEKYLKIIEWNPLFPILRMFRDVLLNNQLPQSVDLTTAVVEAVVFLMAGLLIFYKTQDRFILHL
jgi:ABC-type polysaccharide/polyol phosphate export systems, permease component